MKRALMDFWELLIDFTVEVVLPMLLSLAVISGIAFTVGRYVDESSCQSFGKASGRVVKFVDYNLVDWGCLTPASGGWIDVDNIRDAGSK